MSPSLTRTLLALTFVTGIVDAVSFLALGQVFAAMQTGNVIFLGLGVAGSDVSPGELSAYASITLLSLAMGLRNTVVRGFAGPNLATTVLNLTMTALTSPAPLNIASGSDLAQRAAAFVAILAGAATGALLLETSLTLPLATAAAITLAAGLAHLRLRPAAV